MTLTAPRPAAVRPRRGLATRSSWLVVAVAVLAVLCLFSLAVGAQGIPLGTVWRALWTDDGSDQAFIVADLRIPRTLIGLGVGAALGLTGALMQGLTRNPLADPGILGVNAGSSAAVVLAIAVFGVTTPAGYVWFAFAGAAAAAVVVYLLGATGRVVSPERTVLAGAAVSAVLVSFVSTVLLLSPDTFDSFRFWAIGSLAGRRMDIVVTLAPFLLVGIVLALGLGRALNALALGDQTGAALGVRLGRTRLLTGIAVTLLCGVATAAVGPIGFVGLTVPHVARMIVGPDQRWVLPYSMVLAPVLLLAADVVGRVALPSGELEVGIVTAFLGAPVFVLLCRRRRIAQL
ncbi:iron chelate uptake ABC transporter family permease subunit [Pseudonocardia ailaonensis]|uniref:Iron chelate uptake ABC transporter family permease subunit n=1 Tax=Pseudonocardia ailaonensis TaxID=367279 RepID=A0ABN2N9J8_9PSEU